MDAIKAQLAKLQEQLSGLSASQRMLAGSLVAIMVLTMMFWARYASSADMVPVLKGSAFTPEQVARATMALKAHGIECATGDSGLMVPADQQVQAFSVLSLEQALPSDTKSGFDDIIAKTTPFDTGEKDSLMFNEARGAALAEIIKEWPGVRTATVVINPETQRHIGQTIHPTATVSIMTRQGEQMNTKQLVESAAAAVAGTVSDLARSAVSVTVNGRVFRTHDTDSDGGMSGDEQDDRQSAQEQKYYEKIERVLTPYVNPLISVSVKLDLQSGDTTKIAYDNTTTLQKEISTENDTQETTQDGGGAKGEPGVEPNTGDSVVSSTPSSGGTTSSTEKSKSQYQILPGQMTQHIRQPGGAATVIGATVVLPRSYFIKLYQDSHPNSKEPDDKTLNTEFADNLSDVAKQVSFACGADPKVINVGIYHDAPMLMAASETTSTSSTAQLGSALGGHVKEMAVGALAIASLFMVSMMVRKAAPPAIAVSVPQEPRIIASLGTGDDIAGIASPNDPALDGMELDDETVRSQQMVEQVTTMVKENPDAAANLVKRWLNRT